MATEINVDFEKLDSSIGELKALLSQLDEPSFDKLNFWLSNKMGSGMVCDYAYSFGARTIEFYNGVYALIKGTIAYLKEIKKLKTADQTIADKL